LTSTWRALRRRILTPSMSETKLSVRGFHEKSAADRDLLETVGATFLTGYAHAAEARLSSEVANKIDTIDKGFRGFAYEGAAMALAMRDGLSVRRSRLSAEFIAGPARDHVYMAYVGVGWALARLPRFRWDAATTAVTDPLLRWLVLDGYGFHQAYFHTERYVRKQYQEPRFPWPGDGPADYASRVIDQGIGRALWFVAGSDPDLAVTMIDKFAEARRADLLSGCGLAATYSGSSDEHDLRILAERAGEHRAQVAQAAAFAAETRVRAGLVMPHTTMATQVLCGMTPQEAAEVVGRLRPARALDGAVAAYEMWRTRLAEQFANADEC
jgi:enediyne biosynthesis protein E3